MKLEGIIICVNYSDFLKNTLPHNKNFFNKLVVVTDSNDKETKKVCEFYNVQCVITDDFYDGDSKIPNKAKGINAGLKNLSCDGWVLHIDADVWLPPLTKHILEHYPLVGDRIYGIDRMMCNSYSEWYNFINNISYPVHEGWIYLHLHTFPIGQRIVQYQGEGYMPIGFFQLWNPKISGITTYPVEQPGYDRTDVLHLKQFPPEKRDFIPDLVCVHLASQKHAQGQNWLGRSTKEFRPDEFTPIELIWFCIKKLFTKKTIKILEY